MHPRNPLLRGWLRTELQQPLQQAVLLQVRHDGLQTLGTLRMGWSRIVQEIVRVIHQGCWYGSEVPGRRASLGNGET